MTEISIRRVTGYELSQIRQSIAGYAFASDTPPPISILAMEQTANYLEDDHYFALYLDGDPIATAGNRPMTQNVRGAIYPVWGVWNVGVLPAFRRRGYAHQLMAHLLADTREAGGVLSTLYPFRESFYERMGYAAFPQARKVIVQPENLRRVFALPLEGEFKMQLYKQGFAAYHEFLQQLQVNWHGFGRFDGAAVELMSSRNSSWQVLVELDGRVIGAMLYRIHNKREILSAYHFYYTEPMGRYKLLEWLALHIDQVKSIEIQLAASEQPDTWLADMNPDFRQTIGPMGRVVDIMQLNGLPVAAAGEATFTLSDTLCNWNNGTFRLEATEGTLTVTTIEEDEDADHLTIHGLSALVYGTHDPAEFTLRGWGNLTATTCATLRALFSPQKPHLHERF
jgi:predicted acetyltransferase